MDLNMMVVHRETLTQVWCIYNLNSSELVCCQSVSIWKFSNVPFLLQNHWTCTNLHKPNLVQSTQHPQYGKNANLFRNLETNFNRFMTKAVLSDEDISLDKGQSHFLENMEVMNIQWLPQNSSGKHIVFQASKLIM